MLTSLGQETVQILGDGVAAAACAHLLRSAQIPTAVESASRPKLPAVMIGAATQHLMGELFGQDVFGGLTQIRQRVVLWGQSDAVTVPHAAVVAPEAVLLDRLRAADGFPTGGAAEGPGAPAWTIYASRRLPEGIQEHHFGSRYACAATIRLRPGAAQETCWIEAVAEGWLFLLPDGSGGGWLLSVGGAPGELLERSRLIALCVEGITNVSGRFVCHPRVIDPLCDPVGWLACGTTAIGFDPLCGDGMGNAVREAILAAAAVKAVLREGADPQMIASHYRKRVQAAFARHLEACLEFYRMGQGGPWWEAEVEATRAGLAWTRQRLGMNPVFHFRLNGFTLEQLQ